MVRLVRAAAWALATFATAGALVQAVVGFDIAWGSAVLVLALLAVSLFRLAPGTPRFGPAGASGVCVALVVVAGLAFAFDQATAYASTSVEFQNQSRQPQRAELVLRADAPSGHVVCHGVVDAGVGRVASLDCGRLRRATYVVVATVGNATLSGRIQPVGSPCHDLVRINMIALAVVTVCDDAPRPALGNP